MTSRESRAGERKSDPVPAEQVVDYKLVRSLQDRVADRLTLDRQQRHAGGHRELGPGDERQLTLKLIREEIRAHRHAQLSTGRELPDASVDTDLARALEAAIYGAGALQPLLDDPDVENIDINGCDEVWVTYGDARGKVRAAAVAGSDKELIDIIRRLGAYAGPNARPFTATSPELDLRLGDGSRLSAVMAATERPVLSIRRSRYQQMFLARFPPPVPADADAGPGTAQTLLQLGTVDEQLAAFLEAAVLARCNIIVAGATDAGKTTLLRALINCVPAHERLVTVERALELGLRRHPHLHPDVVEMEEVLPGPDGAGGLSIGQLVRRSRRQNPSRVIVGEVLGPEVVEMLSAMSQGNDGSLSTIHSRDAHNVFARLATYAAQHEHLDFPVTYALIGACIDLVLFVRKDPHGRRVVSEVLEVTGSADGHVTASHIFVEGPDGRAERDGEIPIMRRALLAAHGYDDGAWSHWPGQPEPAAPDPARRFGRRAAASDVDAWPAPPGQRPWGG